jgi:hypothetical protein
MTFPSNSDLDKKAQQLFAPAIAWFAPGEEQLEVSHQKTFTC